MKKVIVIGIAGGSAAGKSAVAGKLKEVFSGDVEIISQDHYYHAHDRLTYDARTKLNYDHPDAYDMDLLIQHIKALKNGETICRPVYNYVVDNRSKEIVLIHETKIVVVEGIMVLQNKELRDLMDMKIYVDTDADTRLMRRILRDVNERKRELEYVINQYQNNVKPMYDQFVEPTKRYADIVIPNGADNEIAMAMLIDKVRSIS